MESKLLYHTACPNCRSKGNDTKGNNLAVYSDGHQYCYACGYVVRVNKVQQFKLRNTELPTNLICLPEDVDNSLPQFARDWLEQK